MLKLNCQNIFKILVGVIVSSSLFFFTTSNSFASFSSSAVKLNLTYGQKDLFSHEVPLDLNVKSDADISDVKVQWILPFGINRISGENLIYNTPLSSGSTLSDHVVIDPQSPGTFVITANVSGLYKGNTFSQSSSVYLTFDSSLNLTGSNTLYTVKQVIYILLWVGSLLFFVFLLLDVYNVLKAKFHGWLNHES